MHLWPGGCTALGTSMETEFKAQPVIVEAVCADITWMGALAINRPKTYNQSWRSGPSQVWLYSKAEGKRPQVKESGGRGEERGQHRIAKKGQSGGRSRTSTDDSECFSLCTYVGRTDIFKQIQDHAEQAIHCHLSFNQTASGTGSKNKKKHLYFCCRMKRLSGSGWRK